MNINSPTNLVGLYFSNQKAYTIMATTRQKSKHKLESLIDHLTTVELIAIELGLLYQESDVELSGVMFVVSEMVEVVKPLVEKTNKEL